MVVSAYYGINIFTSALKTAYQNTGSTQTDFKIKGVGPVGGNFEYLMTDKIGLGVDVYYANTAISWNDIGYDANNQKVMYNYKVSVPRVGVLARANFHFSNSDDFDAYGILAMGYKNLSYKFETNDPSYKGNKVNGLIPVAMKLGVGFRYFFTDNFGLNGEMALGTPLLAGGISLKF